MEISAGFSPAWIRLEGGCLIYSSHESFEKWRAVRVLPRPRGVLEALLRCWRPAHDYAMAAAAGLHQLEPGQSRSCCRYITRPYSENGGLEGNRTLISPADNGALCF